VAFRTATKHGSAVFRLRSTLAQLGLSNLERKEVHMNRRKISGQQLTKMLVVALALQMGTTAAFSQSERARERANENARFNREYDRRAMTDSEFLQRAYAQNLAEMKLAHVAVQASRDSEVQKMGHRIINEQQRANDALQKIADSKGVTLSKDLTQQDQQTYDRLSKLQGGEFDRAYRDHLNTDYRQIVRMFRDAAQNAQDQQLRNVASEYATLFEQHASTMGVATTGTAATSTGTAATGTDTAVAAGTSEQRWNRNDGRRYSWERDRNPVRERESASTSTGTSSATGALSKSDEQVVQRIFRQSRMQVRAAQLAAKNAQNNKIKQVAQDIVADHRQLNQELRDLASNRSLTLPTAAAGREGDDNVVDNLEKLSGAEFDRAYRDYLNTSHRNMTRQLESANTSDPDVRTFVARVQNVVQQHMSMLQR
jgi:putative membrane protein